MHTFYFIMFSLYLSKSVKGEEEEEEKTGEEGEGEEEKEDKRKQEPERLELGHTALENAIQNITVMGRYTLEYINQGHSYY